MSDQDSNLIHEGEEAPIPLSTSPKNPHTGGSNTNQENPDGNSNDPTELVEPPR
ncbi:hypothetical protein [Candidatus Albibeggiatoa sp. nov. BB20]|uniref:hypothetical protein n=1 Tax=Candidatus Albibeggiatoa sp. nov. BB20 TaxID=3162723 RepID=UPI0033659223